MEQLLRSLDKKQLNFTRGEQIEGRIIALTPKEALIDLSVKADGVLDLKNAPIVDSIKIGDTIKCFVVDPESESGQIILSLQKPAPIIRNSSFRHKGGNDRNLPAWNKFTAALSQKTNLTGTVTDINRGGLVVEIDGIRGFLPSSHLGSQSLQSDIVGQEIVVNVIEIDPASMRLIFSQKINLTDEVKKNLSNFKNGQKITGKVVAILPFGLFVSLDEKVTGMVLSSESSWEKTEDLNKLFKIGSEVEVIVSSIDMELGRVNLSIRQLQTDPFTHLAEKFSADDVISGIVAEVTPAGISITLAEGVEGFLPSSKVDNKYEVGQKVSMIVDNIDKNRRRVNLAPLVTSTAGLIYK